MEKTNAVWTILLTLSLSGMVHGCSGDNESSHTLAQPQMWCIHQGDHYDVQEVENCRLEPVSCDEGQADCEHTVCDYGAIVGTCPISSECGTILKVNSLESPDQRIVAATWYQHEVIWPKIFLIPPENIQKVYSGIYTETDVSVGDVSQNIGGGGELWVGCRERTNFDAVSSKGSFCLGGRVYKFDSFFASVPKGLPVINCTCNGESTSYRGFDLCLDFDCPLDSDPNVAPKRCPNIDWPDDYPDGDQVEAELSSEDEL